MQHVTFFLFVLVASSVLAYLEINIEGAHGWAARLPTWRVQNRWTRLLLGSRPLTGYHTSLFAFVLLLAHAPLVVGPAERLRYAEPRILAFVTLLWVLEDFLWFAFNPHFGLERFRASDIWWHQDSWLWIAPREYWIFIPVGLFLYWLSIP